MFGKETGLKRSIGHYLTFRPKDKERFMFRQTGNLGSDEDSNLFMDIVLLTLSKHV